MLGPDWKEIISEPAFENAVDFLNELSWNLTWHDEQDGWKIWGGEVLLFRAKDEAEIKAFILGMALSVRALPDELISLIKEWSSE